MQTQWIHTVFKDIKSLKDIYHRYQKEVLFTVSFGAFIFSGLSFIVANTPTAHKVEAHESRIIRLEEAYVGVAGDIQTIADFINEPKVKVLRTKTNSGSGQ